VELVVQDPVVEGFVSSHGQPVILYDHERVYESEHARDVIENGLHIDIYRASSLTQTSVRTAVDVVVPGELGAEADSAAVCVCSFGGMVSYTRVSVARAREQHREAHATGARDDNLHTPPTPHTLG
jgi:hypothetical protein